MAFDGITVAALTAEIKNRLSGGRIYKIAQPEPDEILLTIRTEHGQEKLLLSAGATLPLAYLNPAPRKAPMTAPNFCMLLRKHIQNGRITEILQPGMERCIRITIEHFDELQDLTRKTLILELMGKYSNLIFVNDENMILDSIKHVSSAVSSVREVLPGRTYFLPDAMEKSDPLTASPAFFRERLLAQASPLSKAFLRSFTGISPVMAEEFCHRAAIDPRRPAGDLNDDEWQALEKAFCSVMEAIRTDAFSPVIYYENETPVEFSAVPLTLYNGSKAAPVSSISETIRRFYEEKELYTRIHQKSADLRRIIQTALERSMKKRIIQETQLKSTEKRDKYRLYGELLTAYSYQIPDGQDHAEVENYYDNNALLTIPLDPQLTAAENAHRLFERYQKLKRTYEAVTVQLTETGNEIEYLESVAQALAIAQNEADLLQIKEELTQTGFLRFHGRNRSKHSERSLPLHFVSSDGFDIYVGKNNLQNEELTFKTASGSDWWFHAKQMPGSHVIVKAGGADLPDRTFEEAARLAAHFSSGADSDKVEIDYVQRKHLHKPNGARPGYTIYHTNYSMTARTDIKEIRQIL